MLRVILSIVSIILECMTYAKERRGTISAAKV